MLESLDVKGNYNNVSNFLCHFVFLTKIRHFVLLQSTQLYTGKLVISQHSLQEECWPICLAGGVALSNFFLKCEEMHCDWWV